MSQRGDALSSIPVLGSGLGYRREMKQEILKSQNEIDFLEIVTEQFFDDPTITKELYEICEKFVVIPHGIGLSIGSVVLDVDYLREIKTVSEITACPYYSEHLAVTRAPGIDIGHLSPVWFTESVLRNTIVNVSRVQDYLSKPVALENVTYTFDIPAGGMKQTEFFGRLVEATGCGILLDVTNVYINSFNHTFDPIEFLKQMPLGNVVQIHLAGGYMKNGVLIDGHCEPVAEESWYLLETLAGMVRIRGSILEQDANFPADISVLLDQLDRARKIISRSKSDSVGSVA
jgi:uncharacterized protein (UPF0276 family)